MVKLAFREAKEMGDASPDLVAVSCSAASPSVCTASVRGRFTCSDCRTGVSEIELVIDRATRTVTRSTN
jgi:hypothetical protein